MTTKINLKPLTLNSERLLQEIPALLWPWLIASTMAVLLAMVAWMSVMIRGPAFTGILLIPHIILQGMFIFVVHRRANEFKAELNERLSIATDALKKTKGSLAVKDDKIEGLELVAF